MSDKIKETINNLSQKYEETSWKNILPPTFQMEQFSKLLSKLLKDKQDGINWVPSFKDLFASYTNSNIKEIDVVVIAQTPEFIAPEKLLKQGVLYLSVPMFEATSDPTRYVEESKDVMFSIVSKLAYQTTGCTYVFIGELPEKLGGCVDNKHHKKVFLPHDCPDEISFKEIVNNILVKPIVWD